MNAAQKLIFDWPEMPALPPAHQPVLIRVATARSRPLARQELRAALRHVLAAWSNLPPDQLPLHETSSGPIWPGQLAGQTLDISLSYAAGEGWIGLLRAGCIGVDVMPVQHIPEAEEVARHYLGPDALTIIQASTDSAASFATAWTGLEARLKCLKQDLNEWTCAQSNMLAGCAVQTMMLNGRLIVTVASLEKSAA
ncbi:MAG TPA: 4'-phosphopantetheinyl transferase superfamily protein [Candidatus Acidoferrales bacterium]|jgi:phosphopantetheinyl transferase|nr:4'-phosphopantetheinyl transferase superfamily protein [Candidatus Acidoferrales bacterium]